MGHFSKKLFNGKALDLLFNEREIGFMIVWQP